MNVCIRFQLYYDSLLWFTLQEVADEIILSVGQAFEVAYQAVVRARSKYRAAVRSSHGVLSFLVHTSFFSQILVCQKRHQKLQL